MSSKVQLVIDRGIFEKDPDGMLWLSAKAKNVIAAIEEDETLMAAIKERATDEEDARVGFWTLVLMRCCGKASSEELDDGVHVLLRWGQKCEELRLKDWSMRLRLR